jgi:DNA-binding MurR/RpiR family transcriptional regulator
MAKRSKPALLTIEQRIRAQLSALTPAERQAARSVLSAYPIAALETIAELGRRSETSAPTILRWLAKLGYAGLPEFQRAVLQEVQARMESPLSLLDATPRVDRRAGGFMHGFLDSLANSLKETEQLMDEGRLAAVVQLLADPRRRIVTIGGRSSHIQAKFLAFHLHYLRAGVQEANAAAVPIYYQTIDLRRRDVVVAFDYRRYERQTIEYCRGAARQGAAIVLVTDPWLSPIADFADHVIPLAVNVPSPFDSTVPGVAIIEVLLAGVLERLGRKARERMERIEERAGEAKDGFVAAPQGQGTKRPRQGRLSS